MQTSISKLKDTLSIQVSDIDNLNGMISLKDRVLIKMKKNQNHKLHKISLVASNEVKTTGDIQEM